MDFVNRFREYGFGFVDVLGVAMIFRRGKTVITCDLRNDKVLVKGELEKEVQDLVEEMRSMNSELSRILKQYLEEVKKC